MSSQQLNLQGIKQLKHQTLLKWPGNKTQLLKQIGLCVSQYGSFENYYEPFLGSGAVYFYLKKNKFINQKSFLNDYLSELILFYKIVKNPKTNEKIIKKISEIIYEYNSLQKFLNKKEMYLSTRDRYNELLVKKNRTIEESIEQSALLYFLNKACFNGVYRKSKKGKFNVPHGRRVGNSQSLNFDNQIQENFRITQTLLRKTKLTSISYINVLDNVSDKDFVYLDPPYVDNFTDYTSEGFGDTDFNQLVDLINELTNKKTFFLMSNSNTSKTLDIFYDKKLYCYEIGVTRTIDRTNKSNKGSTTELLISNYELNALGNSIW